MNMLATSSLAALAVLALTGPARPSPQAQVFWEAPDGVLPDDASPPWTKTDTSSAPVMLGPTSLSLQTSAFGQNQWFKHEATQLEFPAKLRVEAGIWYVSGSTLSPVREAVTIFVALPTGMANALWVGQDEIFLYAGSNCGTKGNSVALPTMDGFHEYCMEIDTLTGVIEVLYDGQPSGLTGDLIPMDASCSAGSTISWGEISTLAYGTSEWAYVRHNAGATGSVVSYCTSGTSVSGCQAQISASGEASASASSGFVLRATGVEGNKNGRFFLGANGRQANSWGNGTSFQCVLPPVTSAGLLAGSGTPGLCDGSFSQDMTARWQQKPAQNPGAGAVVQAQLWYRDPFSTSNQTTSLSNAVEFAVGP